jgi:hypothetical protein
MSSKTIRSLCALALAAVAAACVALPALATTNSPSVKWARSVPLLNPNDGGGLDAVSCAPAVSGSTTLLCVAGDVRGEIFASDHPARSAAYWHREKVDLKVAVTGVSCPSTQLCVAVDANGQVMHSTAPLAGAASWSKPAQVDSATQTGGGPAGFAAVSCPTTTFCLAVDNSANGQVAYTTDPTGPASAWTLTTIGQGVLLDSVSCTSATFCMIGGSNAYYSTTPTGGASAWKAVSSLTSSNSVIASLACNTIKLCIGVGYGDAGTGLAVASSTPSTGSWTTSVIGANPPAPQTHVVDSVACPLRNLCVAVDGSSHAYTSATPVRGNWSLARPLKKASQATVSQVSCNSMLCIEVDNRGTVTYGVVKGGSTTPSTTGTTQTTKTSATTTSTTSTKTGTTTT